MDKALLKDSEISYKENVYTVKTPSGKVYKISPKRFEKMSAEYDRQKKSKKVAGWLCVFLGFLGVHRYYVGDYLKGFLLLGTFGGMLFGWPLDYFFVQIRVDEINRDLLADLLSKAIESTRKDEAAEEHKLKQEAV